MATRCEAVHKDYGNEACNGAAVVRCGECDMPICVYHAWTRDGDIVCAICYGVEGYTRASDEHTAKKGA